MQPRLLPLTLFVVLVGPLVAVARAEISADEVRRTIHDGVTYLLRQQRVDGTWTEFPGQVGGETSLCLLALLNAGAEPDDDHIQRALHKLSSTRDLPTTYSRSLQTMVFCRADPKRYALQINRNVVWLQKNQITEGPRKGAWSYPGGNGDNSNSQFALLALYEAQRAFDALRTGVHVDAAVWRRARAYWKGCQNSDGSWGYYKDVPGTGSMTCAGIASLVIANDMVNRPDANVKDGQVQCCGQGSRENDEIERGIDWLGQNFTVSGNPGAVREQLWWLYYLYGLERVGRMTSRRLIGGHDWYREGADFLIRQQAANLGEGYWQGPGHAENDPVIGTSLALLFLAKGRRPVLLAKLRHGPGEDWNEHRNDVGNLVVYVESRWKRELTWQVVDLDKAAVDDLMQAPVVYLCGKFSPLPRGGRERQELAQKLRDHLDHGGFLFAEGYCGGGEFDRGFHELMQMVFPDEPEYRLKLLDPSHPIWRAEEKVAADQLRPLLGIEFGCRTSVVYAPPDPPGNPRPSLSCLWELGRSGREQTFPAAVQAQIDAARQIGVNILAYATNRELKWKDEIPAALTDRRNGDQVERGKISVANLRHPGGCDVAPRALVNLMEAAAGQLKLRVDLHPATIGLTDPALFDHPMVFMHGRNSFHLTDAERAALRTYVDRGGVVLADAICASRAFADSFRREMAAAFPDRAGKDPGERSAVFDRLRRLRPRAGFPPRSAAARDEQSAERPPQPRAAGVGGDSPPRSLRGDLLAVRLELRLGEARLVGVPRLRPRGRREDRAERPPLRAALTAGVGRHWLCQ